MATLLPNGKQTFLDANGEPLAGGSVTFYIPGTTTLKDTYLDAAAATRNQNPVTLDAAGQAIIYGVGSYRQVVKDQDGNLIWDQVTTDTSSAAIWAGTSGGLANAQTVTVPSFSNGDGQAIDFIASATNTGAFALVPNGGAAVPVKKDTSTGPAVLAGGEIVQGNAYRAIYDASGGFFHITATPSSIPSGAYAFFAMTSAPLGWLTCDGTAYSAALYPALFAAIGYTYGGSGGTFNVPDGKGRTLAMLDGGNGLLYGWPIGTKGGETTHTLGLNEIPPHAHGGFTGGQTADHSHTFDKEQSGVPYQGQGTTPFPASTATSKVATSGTSNDHAHPIGFDGGGGSHNNVQPTLVGFLCIKI